MIVEFCFHYHFHSGILIPLSLYQFHRGIFSQGFVAVANVVGGLCRVTVQRGSSILHAQVTLQTGDLHVLDGSQTIGNEILWKTSLFAYLHLSVSLIFSDPRGCGYQPALEPEGVNPNQLTPTHPPRFNSQPTSFLASCFFSPFPLKSRMDLLRFRSRFSKRTKTYVLLKSSYHCFDFSLSRGAQQFFRRGEGAHRGNHAPEKFNKYFEIVNIFYKTFQIFS